MLCVKSCLGEEFDVLGAGLEAVPSAEGAGRLVQLLADASCVRVLDQLLKQAVGETQLNCSTCSATLAFGGTTTIWPKVIVD
jgi:hypothetical protein